MSSLTSEQPGTASPAAQPVARAAMLSSSSRLLITFSAVHFAILFAMVEVTRLGLASTGAPHRVIIRSALVAAFLVNLATLGRKWLQVRREPPSPLVPRRIRVHLMLLRASRATVFMALCVSVALVTYLLAKRFLTPDPRIALHTLAVTLICPVILGLKLRWLTVWQKRLTRKATDAAIVF